MAHNEWAIHDGVSLGIDWNASSNATQVSIAPTIWRWDAYTTDNYGSYLAERLSPDPTGAGYWDGYEYGSGSGWRKIDSFATRTYTRTHSTQYVNLTLYTDSEFGTWYNGWVSLYDRSNTWTLPIDPKASYSVTYNANGGSGAPSAQTKWYGESLTLSSTKPTRTGYTFKQWNTKSDGTGTSYAAGASYTGNAALTLYAQWTPITYTISYNGNGATGGSTASQTKTHSSAGGSAVTVRANGFTRTNYAFKNWNTAANGSGTAYTANSSTYSGNANLMLYAQWYAPYAVSYNSNGGTGTVSAQTKVHGTTLQLQANTYTRAGYQFWHWNTKADNTGTTYAASESYTANAAATMYAIWNPIVSYDANGGTGAPAQQVKTYGTALALSSTVPTRTGFSFKNWNTASDGTGTSYSPGASYTANTALSLHAIWQATVSYDSNGGAGAPQPQTADYGATVTIPEITPTFAGRTFLGWNTARDGSGTGYQPGDTYSASNGDLALYAQWRVDIVVSDVSAYIADANGNADALGRYVRVLGSYDTTLSGSDCTMFSATLTAASETQYASNLGAVGSADFLFGPYAYTLYNPAGGYAGGVITAANELGQVEVPFSIPATGYKTPVLSLLEDFRTEAVVEEGVTVYREIEDGNCIGLEVTWNVTPSQSQAANLHASVYDMTAGREVAVRDWQLAGTSGAATRFDIYPDASQWPDDVLVDGVLADTDRQYMITATLSDLYSDDVVSAKQSRSEIVTVAFFTIDFKAGGHGVAFGKPSREDRFDVGMNANFDKGVSVKEQFSLPVFAFATVPDQDDIPLGPCIVVALDTFDVYHYDGDPTTGGE